VVVDGIFYGFHEGLDAVQIEHEHNGLNAQTSYRWQNADNSSEIDETRDVRKVQNLQQQTQLIEHQIREDSVGDEATRRFFIPPQAEEGENCNRQLEWLENVKFFITFCAGGNELGEEFFNCRHFWSDDEEKLKLGL
jgi:hypothetical protein